MSTGFYLLDHPNPNGDHFYDNRRKKLVAQIIHITAGLEDTDLIGPDNSCEAVSRYAATTPRDVSWHSGSDSDSFIHLLPYSYTAWQCVNYNSSTAGHEISKLDTDWRDEDPEWVTRTLHNAADCIRPNMVVNNIPFRKATKAEVDRAIATNGPPVGLIGHHELDPDRRQDPGLFRGIQTFPWDRFIRILKKLENITPPQIPEELMQKQVVLVRASNRAWLAYYTNTGFARIIGGGEGAVVPQVMQKAGDDGVVALTLSTEDYDQFLEFVTRKSIADMDLEEINQIPPPPSS